MPGPTVWVARKLFLRYGWPAVKVVVSLVGVDELARIGWRWLLRTTGTHPERRRAIRRAEQVDGLIGTALLDDGAHWVVFRQEHPVAAYPRFDGDLAAALCDYRRDQLRSPDALPSRRAQAWFKARIPGFVKRAGDKPSEIYPAQASGTDEVKRVVDQLEPLLARLTGAPKAKLSSSPSIPTAPGVYLFSDGPNPIYVGQARDLHERLAQQTAPLSTEDSAPLAFGLALVEAEAQGLGVTGTRKEIAEQPEFEPLLRDARRRVADMNVQYIELDDPVTRSIFEVYAARALGTDEFNSRGTH